MYFTWTQEEMYKLRSDHANLQWSLRANTADKLTLEERQRRFGYSKAKDYDDEESGVRGPEAQAKLCKDPKESTIEFRIFLYGMQALKGDDQWTDEEMAKLNDLHEKLQGRLRILQDVEFGDAETQAGWNKSVLRTHSRTCVHFC